MAKYYFIPFLIIRVSTLISQNFGGHLKKVNRHSDSSKKMAALLPDDAECEEPGIVRFDDAVASHQQFKMDEECAR